MQSPNQAQHNQPTAHQGLAPKRPSAGCFDEADILRRVRRLIVFAPLLWSARGSGVADFTSFTPVASSIEGNSTDGKRALQAPRHRQETALQQQEVRARMPEHPCHQQSCPPRHRRSPHLPAAAWQALPALLCTGRGDTIRLRSGWRRLCIRLQRQRSVCKVFGVRAARTLRAAAPVLQASAPRLPKKPPRNASHEEVPAAPAPACQATTRGFPAALQTRAEVVEGAEQPEPWAARSGHLPFQAKVAAGSKMGGGSAPTSGGSAARKAGGTGSGTDKTSAGEQKVPQPKHRHPTGLAHSLTARQAPQQPERKLFGQEPEEPPCARRIIRPRHWHGRWSHVGQRYVGQKRWWGRWHERFGRIKHLGAVTAAHPAIRNAQLVRDHLELGRTGGAACDLAHLQWIVERRPHSPRGLARLNGWRSSKSSRLPNRPLAVAAMGHRPPSAHLPAAPECLASTRCPPAATWLHSKGPARAVASPGCWPVPSGIHPGPCRAGLP